MSQKIVFMGTPEFSVPTLDSLVNSEHEILTVYSQPASKANRGQKVIPSSVEIFAKKKSLNIRTPKKLDTDEEYNFLKKIKCRYSNCSSLWQNYTKEEIFKFTKKWIYQSSRFTFA